MKAYVISLKRAEERRRYITKHLQALGIEFEIIDAVDYKQMSPDEFAKLSDTAEVQRNPCLTQGAIACALSHSKVYEAIAASKDKAALVLEDDAMLPANIQLVLKDIEENIQLDEVISISYYGHFVSSIYLSSQQSTRTSRNATLYYPTNLRSIASAMAYIITPTSARKLGQLIAPVSATADQWGIFFERGGFNSFRCYYPIDVIPYPFPTTLNYNDAGSLKSRFAQFVKKNNIPVLSHYLQHRYKKMILAKHRVEIVDKPPYFAQ